MENENKEMEQACVKEWDEKQIYKAEIMPKVVELTELLKKHKIPFIFHSIPAQDKKQSTATLIANNGGKASPHLAVMGCCADMLNGDISRGMRKITKIALLKFLADEEESE